MKSINTSFLNHWRLGILILLFGAACLLTLRPTRPIQGRAESAAQGSAAIEQLKKDGSYGSLAAAMNAARYHIQPGANHQWQAPNPAQQFNVAFSGAGVQIAETLSAQPQWQCDLKLTGYGRGQTPEPVSEGKPESNGNRIEIRKAQLSNPNSEITEWYVNNPEGLEQGFTLHKPPSPVSDLKSPGTVRLVLQLTGGLRAETVNSQEDNQAIVLKDKQGRPALSYGHLAAWDANHKVLPATMKTDGRKITLEVDDAAAVYPVTIDPLFAQLQKLAAADGVANDYFGRSIALSGNTAIIGVVGNAAGVNHGAYVFVRSGTTWNFQAKLTAADGLSNDFFGYAVALDGDTAAVSAIYALNGNGNEGQGAVYVFTRSGVNWSLQQKFFANDPQGFATFGQTLALGGNTLLVGAPQTAINGSVNQGAAYVFTRGGTLWTQQQKLTADDGAANDLFGYSVSLSGETAIIGAYAKATARGAAYVFVRQGGLWNQQQKLLANDGVNNDRFGRSVALNGNTAAIGANGCNVNEGAVYVFTRSGTTWTQQQKLTAGDGAATSYLGNAVALSGNVLVAAADYYHPGNVTDQGAVYVFARSGATWTQQTSLHALDKDADSRFGSALALSGNTVLVGAPSDTIGANVNQGSVYSFQIVNTPAYAQEIFDDNGKLNSEFGASLAVHNNTAVVGSRFDTISGLANHGSAYVYVRNGANWTFQQKLLPGDGAAQDEFGDSLAVYGDSILIGAPFKGNGAAYVFTRSGTTWTQQQKLFANDGAAGDRFGLGVALYLNTALIGASNDTVGANGQQGSAYVFTRSGATWSQQTRLTANDGTAADHFGRAVALYGNAALIGAPDDSPGGNAGRGSAYIFTGAGASWTQGPKLTAADGGVNHNFGWCVALDNYTAIVGAPGNGGGAAYVYDGHTGTWTLQQQLVPATPAPGNKFGFAVALFGDLAAVGAPEYDSAQNQNEGAAYLFERRGATWSQVQRFTAGDADTGDRLGGSVAVSGPEVLSGAYQDDLGQVNQGEVYVFRYTNCPAVTINQATLPDGAFGISYNQQLSAGGGVGPYSYEITNGALPTGLTLSAGGLLSGTAGQGGTFSFTITARTDGLCSGSQNYTVTISFNCPQLSINPGGVLPPTPRGQPYNQQLTVTNGTAPFVFKLFGALPPGITLHPVTGLLSGTPNVPGTYQFQIGVVDFNGCESLRAFTLVVACPTITVNPASLPSGTAGIGGYNQALSAGGGVAPYTFSLNSGDALPAGLSLVNGAIVGGPQQGGSFTFTILATDAQGCVGTRQYTLQVQCQVSTVFPATLPTMTIGVPFNQGLSAAGSDGPYTYSLGGGTLPSGLDITTGGLLSGTPTTSGSGSFTVNAADVYGCVTPKQYNFTVNCGTLTILPSNLADGATGLTYSRQLSTTGGNGTYTYSLPIGVLPPPGLSLSPSGLLSGTPTQAGQFNLTVNVASGGCTGQQNYTLTITQTCGTLTITPATLPNGTIGVPYNQQLTTDGGTGNISYAVTSGSLPAGLMLSSSGLLEGTPTQGFVANITVTATDANGCTGQKNYVLTVTCPTITVGPATLPNGTTGTTYNQQLTQTGGVGNTTFGVTFGSPPQGLSLSSSGLLSGTPTQAGTVNFNVTASDVNGCIGTRQYSLTINAGCPTINIGPNPPGPAFVGVHYQHTFIPTGGTAPYTYSLVAGSLLLDGLTLSTAGVLSGTPTGIGGFGSAFTVKATDANGCVGQVEFGLSLASCPTITVNPSNATLPAGQAGQTYNQTFTQTGGNGVVTFTVSVGALPNGLSLSTGGGLTGTPTAFGDFNFTVKATNANGCSGSRAYSLHINAPCAAITVNPAGLPNGTVGATYNQTATATGGTAPYTYSISAGALPGGLNIASGGALTGTPNTSGVFNFTIKATDANGCMGTRAYSVTINGNVVNNGLRFYPLPKPLRLLDTRAGQLGCDAPGAQIPGGTSRTQLARRTCDGITIPATALAVTGNITTVQSGGGYLTLYPSDAQQPLVANSNYAPNEVINNVFTVGLGNADGSFKIFVTTNTDVVVDITGYYAPPMAGPDGLYFHPLPKPIRLLETRAGFSGAFTPGDKLTANADTPQQARVTYDGVTIPASALAIVGNATSVNGGAGYMTLYPGGVARPLAASSNFSAGQVMNAPFTVGLSATGEFNIFTTTSMDLIVDVLGYYSTDASDANGTGLLFNPLPAPVRLLETRAGLTGCNTPGAPLLTGSTRQQQARGACGGQTIANDALAIVGNATVVNNQAGYLTFWPNGAAQPLVASSNFAAGQVLNRHFTVGLGATGMFNIFASAQTDLIVDVSGFFAP